MKAIIELVKISNINSLNRHLYGGKSLALIKGIKSGRIKTREDGMRVLFKGSAAPMRSLYYLIERTKRKLMLGLVLSINPQNEYKKAEVLAAGGYATVIVLFGNGKRTTAVSEAKKVFKIAAKYEFIHIASALALKLVKHFGEIKPDRKQFHKYSALAKHYTDCISDALFCQTQYSKTIYALGRRTGYTPGIIKMLSSVCAKIADKTATVDMVVQIFGLKVIHCFSIQDYSRGALICQDALKHLESKPAARNSQKAQFLIYRGVCATAAKQYSAAESSFLQALELSAISEHNYQIISYYRAINYLHQQKYFKAQLIRDQAAERKQSAYIKEYWSLINAYLYFFNGGKFRLGKFFNETIEASKDKTGANINIIIADLIISVTDKRDRFLHRLEAVQTYSYRHLKGKQTERARFFLDLLFQVPRHDFNRRRIERSTRHTILKLSRRSVYANHNLEIEIVPLEAIWEKILDRLEGKETIRAIV